MPHGSERPVSHLHEDAMDALDGLIATAARHPAELLIILDDFHNVDGPEVAAILDTLFVRISNNVKVAISSRLAVGLASSRLLAAGTTATSRARAASPSAERSAGDVRLRHSRRLS